MSAATPPNGDPTCDKDGYLIDLNDWSRDVAHRQFSAQALPFWLPPHQPLALQHALWHTTSPLGAKRHNARAPPGSEAY